MMNYLVNVAAKDGTIIGSPFAANVIEPLSSGRGDEI